MTKVLQRQKLTVRGGKLGSDRFCKIGPAAACMADCPESTAPKSPQEHRPGSTILSERIINQALISRNAPKSASLFRPGVKTASAVLASIPLSAASQAIPDHICRPAEKTFLTISVIIFTNIDFNLLQRFPPAKCPPPPNFRNLRSAGTSL